MRSKVLMTLLLGVMALVAYGQPENAQLRKEMEQFYAQQDRFVTAGRDAALMKMVHPNFVVVDKQGRQKSLAQFQAQLAGLRRSTRGVRMKTVVKHVRTQGPDEAVAWVEQTVHFKVQRGDRWVAQKETARYAETHVRTANGWKTTYAQELPTDEPWSFKTGS